MVRKNWFGANLKHEGRNYKAKSEHKPSRVKIRGLRSLIEGERETKGKGSRGWELSNITPMGEGAQIMGVSR